MLLPFVYIPYNDSFSICNNTYDIVRYVVHYILYSAPFWMVHTTYVYMYLCLKVIHNVYLLFTIFREG